MERPRRYELRDPPTDGITSMEFGRNNNQFLVVGSWDKYLRMYDMQTNGVKKKIDIGTPVLDVSVENPLKGYCSGLDGSIWWADFMTGAVNRIGSHQKGAKCVNYSFLLNSVFSGSWDATFGHWDPRSNTAAGTYDLPSKVLAMDVLKDKLAIATADQEITIFDVRNLNKPFQKSHSNLRTLFRCIKILPTLDGFAYGTVEGRASVDSFIVNDEPLFKRYAFKCHRQFYNGYDHVYPVNAIEFHTEGTFITAGGDGTISTWCPKQRKKMRTFQYYPTSISSVAFTADGEYMAVASSYTFEEGEKDHPPDAIYIQSVAPIDFVSDKTKLNNERSTISDDNSIAA